VGEIKVTIYERVKFDNKWTRVPASGIAPLCPRYDFNPDGWGVRWRHAIKNLRQRGNGFARSLPRKATHRRASSVCEKFPQRDSALFRETIGG